MLMDKNENLQDPKIFVKEEWADIVQEVHVTVAENYNTWQKSQLGGVNFHPDTFFFTPSGVEGWLNVSMLQDWKSLNSLI